MNGPCKDCVVIGLSDDLFLEAEKRFLTSLTIEQRYVNVEDPK